MSGPLYTASEAWGDDMPDWIRALAEACEESSQNKVAAEMGCSASKISQVLRNRYPSGLKLMEEAVRGKFMREIVQCPALGELPTHECQAWRKESGKLVGVNNLRVRMFKACNRCPLNGKGKGNV